MDNKTSAVTNDIYKMACEIRKNESLKRDIVFGGIYKELYEKYGDFKHIIDKFMRDKDAFGAFFSL